MFSTQTSTPRFSGSAAKGFSMECQAYRHTPPPSPTRDLSIPRFESSEDLDDTPSLLHSALLDASLLNTPSFGLDASLSSPSPAFKPIGYATTRRAQDASFSGLGVFMPDGSMVDGMGLLPMQEPTGCSPDKVDAWTGDDSMYNDEEPWRKRLSFHGNSAASRLFSPAGQAFGCSSPAPRRDAHQPVTTTEQEEDDVFFSTSPVPCGSPPSANNTRDKRQRHHRRDSAAVVMRWFQQMEEAQAAEEETEAC